MNAVERVRAVLDEVVDPEIPVLGIADIGILRDVELAADETVVVTITPTYSGCPALDVIRADVAAALTGAGYPNHEIRTVLSPPWTTDWMSPRAKDKLRAAGIAPPGSTTAVPQSDVPCPQCSSPATSLISAFGSTACQALMVCNSCAEPFSHFKEI